ncbi:MAG: imidazole glycerol phosphate synthase subunit HisF [Methylophaga sp.]|nr:imidazole glycerol phosphate synthase subunit HisF [Methylophaga sp.]
MLKVRIIPTLLWKNFGLVKGESFDSWRQVGTVMPSIKVYNSRDVDELVLLDITATNEKREPDYDSISEFAAECFVPLTYGGGVNDLAVIRKLLLSGADKVVINTMAYKRPQLISEAAYKFGSQCIVASIDVRLSKNNKYECFSHCGQEPTGKDPVEWAKELEKLGAGEILLTSIERDGTMQGYDNNLIQLISSSVTIPVIASGGAGNYEHILEALQKGGASAIAAASIFHFTEQTPAEARDFLAENGIPVRKV